MKGYNVGFVLQEDDQFRELVSFDRVNLWHDA